VVPREAFKTNHGVHRFPLSSRGSRLGDSRAGCRTSKAAAPETRLLGGCGVRHLAPLYGLAFQGPLRKAPLAAPQELVEVRPERGPEVKDQGHSGDGALQGTEGRRLAQTAALTIPAPVANFEGLSNQDNFNLFGFRVNPPDPVGDVGPNHYVEMINLVFAVYDKQGNLLLGPSTPAHFGRVSRLTTAPTPRATRSCCTTSSRIAGSSPSSRPAARSTTTASPFP